MTWEQIKKSNMEPKRIYVCKDGNVWNPLLKYPRNSPCICNSGKKFKKCCLANVPWAISKDKAEPVRQLVRRVRGKDNE